MNYRLIVTNENMQQDLTNLCEEDISVSSERAASPASISFSFYLDVLAENDITIEEGNTVEFYVNDFPMFKGYVFTQSRGLDGEVKITAYDQLRYFKNKYTYQYTNMKASEVLAMVAEDFKLVTGDIEDTGYVIPIRTEDSKTLFDIVLMAVELTLVATKKMFILYDDFGKVSLKNIESLRCGLMLTDDETLTDFEYKTDIDSDTYNQIKLYKDNEETGKRDTYMVRDSENISKWGILQQYEQAESGMNEAQIMDYAERWLKVKNRVKKTLKIECLGVGAGEEKIRGGSIIYIKIDRFGINNWFVCESVKHTFSDNQHELSITVYDF